MHFLSWKEVRMSKACFLISYFLEEIQFLKPYWHSNNLLITISKEVLYEDLFNSGLKTVSNIQDIKLTKIASRNISQFSIVG